MDARSASPSLPGGKDRPGPLSAGGRFARGFFLPFRAFGLILTHRKLLRWALVTGLVSALLFIGLLVALVAWTGDLVGLVWTKPEGWTVALWYLLAALLFGLLFVIGASTLPTLATSPFLDPISADTERLLGARDEEGGGLGRMLAETANSVGKTFLRVSFLLAGHALLLLLWLLPGIGHGLWSACALAWTVLWLAFEYLDIPANRHGYRFRDTARLIRRNPAAASGLGLGLYLVLWVPLLNVLFVPVGAVAATVLYVQLSPGGRSIGIPDGR